MNLDSKIYVAGHRGLVGSAICRSLKAKGYTNIITRTHSELDLTDPIAVRIFFEAEKPEYVFLAAAFVGGILANNTLRADFIYKNLGIQQNVIGESYRSGVKKLLFLGSTCIYPKNAPQPMCESFNIQYGTNFIACMPTNLYGPNDNFDLEHSHVLPAMIRKMILAKAVYSEDWSTIRKDLKKRPISAVQDSDNASEAMLLEALAHFGITQTELSLWGSGKPMREFLWSEDMANACVFLMEHVNFVDLSPKCSEVRNCHINIGTGKDISIRDLAYLIKSVVGYEGKITFDSTKPDGTMKKLTDPSKLNNLGWHHTVELEEGIKRIYDWYTLS